MLTKLTFVSGLLVWVVVPTLGDDVKRLQPKWRGDDRTVMAEWDTWPVPPEGHRGAPDVCSSNPPLQSTAWYDTRTVQKLGQRYGRSNVVKIDGDEPQCLLYLPNYDQADAKDLNVQVTFWFDITEYAPAVPVPQIHVSGGERTRGRLVNSWLHGSETWQYWMTYQYTFHVEPNPDEEWIDFVTERYDGDPGPAYIDQVVIDTRCIPEPATLSLAGLGVLAGLARRRKGVTH